MLRKWSRVLMVAEYFNSRKLDRNSTSFRRLMIQAAYESGGEKNIVDSFAAAHAVTHMKKCVRTSSVAAPRHQEVSPEGA
jgi:hypothetical protein